MLAQLKMVAPPGFEPGSRGPEPRMMDLYTTGLRRRHACNEDLHFVLLTLRLGNTKVANKQTHGIPFKEMISVGGDNRIDLFNTSDCDWSMLPTGRPLRQSQYFLLEERARTNRAILCFSVTIP